ncbi:MAG: T9SS type A sorting domain-containing protein [Bacteroidota bacterium]
MQVIPNSFLITLIILIASINSYAQNEIGKGWEFNENSEGWSIRANSGEISVADGVLKAITDVDGDFAVIGSDVFEVNSDNYYKIIFRLKAHGGTSILLNWETSSGKSVIYQYNIFGDADFHEYVIDLRTHDKWVDNITRIANFTVNSSSEDNTFEIDYFRIVHMPANPIISAFKIERSTIKPDENLKLVATLLNIGDDETSGLNSKLELTENVELINGKLLNEHPKLLPGDCDTTIWEVKFNNTGSYNLRYSLVHNEETIDTVLRADVVNEYWQRDEFLLSAWSPPYAWNLSPYNESVFQEYKNAGFDVGLWVRPEDELIRIYEKYNLKYYISVTNLLGGENYLSHPSTLVAPEITPEMLAKLDPVIQKYKDNPNVLGYHICDEPYRNSFKNIGKVVSYLKVKDPARESFVNIWPGVDDEDYRSYIESLLDQTKLEMLSFDRYIFSNNGTDTDKFFLNIQVIREYALRYGVPFYNIIQAIGTDGTIESDLNWRTPTYAEHKWQSYASLTYGVSGLIWFHWHGNWGVTGNPEKESIYNSIQKLNPEIKIMGAEMMKLKTVGVYHNKPEHNKIQGLDEMAIVSEVSSNANLLIGSFKDSEEKDFVMIMNKDYENEVTATISTQYNLNQLKVFNLEYSDYDNYDFIKYDDRSSFKVTLQPGSAKLFYFSDKILANEDYITKKKKHTFKNSPNPFNTITEFSYCLGEKSHVNISIYDLKGQKVRNLVDNYQQAYIDFKIKWDGKDELGRDLDSGIFIAVISYGQSSESLKIVKY